MKNIVIVVPEEFSNTNHKNLYYEINRITGAGTRVIIVDIAADMIVSRVRHKKFRIEESKHPAIQLEENMYRIRPYFIFRPELLPLQMLSFLSVSFWKQMKKSFPNIMGEEIKVLIYNNVWVPILYASHPNMKLAYYILDERRFEADTNKIDHKFCRFDEFACRHCDVVFTMSNKIAKARSHLNNNILVVGNGSRYNSSVGLPSRRFERSVGFIGHFRDWIDVDLLKGIIESRPNVFFAFVGKVQPAMRNVLLSLLNNYENTAYLGKVSKNNVDKTYLMFDCIIVPYLQNEFMMNTRPIKIVESVFAGTPVVTIPQDGYSENSFIKFATDVESFCQKIDYFISHKIDTQTTEYTNFIRENSWETKAHIILKSL